MTKREYFEKIKTTVMDTATENVIAFLDKEIAMIDTRNKKIKAKRVEKAGATAETIKTAIITALEDAGRAITLAEVVAAAGYTPGKVAYYMRPLIEDGIVVKAKAKVGDRKIMTYWLGV